MDEQPIENYGVIGDLNTAALVGMDGSIDFLCFPRFDSPTVFAALLDREEGGFFRIAPVSEGSRRRQRYLPGTNILLTRFYSDEGVAQLSDFMPIRADGKRRGLVRRIKVVRGEIRFRMTCAPRFDYARGSHTVERRPGGALFRARGGAGLALRLRSDVPLRMRGGAATAEFVLGAGRSAYFVLEDGSGGDDPPASAEDVSASFKDTMNFWLAWISRSRYRGRWREMVDRSALTLKLMTSQPHGSIVAAPTFGLPERIGGERNWDYRLTWIRDASFTLDALMRLGYREEATAFMGWIAERSKAFDPRRPLQTVYALDGSRDVRESVLARFPGYRGSRPVRVGNGAGRQFQLDIYGELLDAVHRYDQGADPISYDSWAAAARLVEWVSKNWRRADRGIWEIRGAPRRFLNSAVWCWVALDRGIQLARRRSFPAPVARWRQTRDRIYREIHGRFWNAELGAFVQYPGARTVDASCLLMPIVGIVSPTDPRWLSTLKLLEKTLVEDSLVYRYDPAKAAPDGVGGREGTFSVCSFWYASALARSGDLKKARFVFEKALGYANHLGLYAEQLGAGGEHLGNFPQALSHLALIFAAITIDGALTEAEDGRPFSAPS